MPNRCRVREGAARTDASAGLWKRRQEEKGSPADVGTGRSEDGCLDERRGCVDTVACIGTAAETVGVGWRRMSPEPMRVGRV